MFVDADDQAMFDPPVDEAFRAEYGPDIFNPSADESMLDNIPNIGRPKEGRASSSLRPPPPDEKPVAAKPLDSTTPARISILLPPKPETARNSYVQALGKSNSLPLFANPEILPHLK